MKRQVHDRGLYQVCELYITMNMVVLSEAYFSKAL